MSCSQARLSRTVGSSLRCRRAVVTDIILKLRANKTSANLKRACSRRTSTARRSIRCTAPRSPITAPSRCLSRRGSRSERQSRIGNRPQGAAARLASSSTATLLTGANVSAIRQAKIRREKLSITAWRQPRVPSRQADDARVDVPHLVRATPASPILDFAGCTRRRGRRQRGRAAGHRRRGVGSSRRIRTSGRQKHWLHSTGASTSGKAAEYSGSRSRMRWSTPRRKPS
jgi:hypothetical protein